MNFKGEKGEKLAADYLIKNNYKIITKNFTCRYGEIDIIAVDNKTKEICFVEVKYRENDKFGLPEESLTPSKLNKIKKTAFVFLNANPYKKFRIDFIGILNKKINHIKNIFI